MLGYHLRTNGGLIGLVALALVLLAAIVAVVLGSPPLAAPRQPAAANARLAPVAATAGSRPGAPQRAPSAAQVVVPASDQAVAVGASDTTSGGAAAAGAVSIASGTQAGAQAQGVSVAAEEQLMFSPTDHEDIRQAVLAGYQCVYSDLAATGTVPIALDADLSALAAEVGTKRGQIGRAIPATEISTYEIDTTAANTGCVIGGLDLQAAARTAGLTVIGVGVALVPDTTRARVVVVGR